MEISSAFYDVEASYAQLLNFFKLEKFPYLQPINKSTNQPVNYTLGYPILGIKVQTITHESVSGSLARHTMPLF